MKTLQTEFEPVKQKSISQLHQRIIAYYQIAGPDYETWSREFNMHFGYFRLGLNPFRREAQLRQMNTEVMKQLGLTAAFQGHVLDLGCGLGTPAIQMAQACPKINITGLTIVPWQISKGNERVKERGLDQRIKIIHADFTAIPMDRNTADAAYAIESMSHSYGAGRPDFVAELHRVLKPGGRFVIADGFIKAPPRKFNSFLRYCYEQICINWSLPGMPEIHSLVSNLKNVGFTDIKVEDISWKVAPTVAHVPFAVLFFLLRSFFKGERLSKERCNHLRGCIMALILGMHRRQFSYYMISGAKA
jgi:cyclopropane fatty-acyl-phospholipid synthase-like methyltransferase